MNTKISKILSVLATVAIVASSFAFAIPVAASTPGDGTFVTQDIPLSGTAGKNLILPGGSIKDIAVGSDGKTIYAVTSFSGYSDSIKWVTTAGAVVGPPITWTAVIAPADSYTVGYTNQDGAAKVTPAFSIPQASVIGASANIPLAAGDTGVRAVTVVTAVVTSGSDSDKFSIVGNIYANNFATGIGGATGSAAAGAALVAAPFAAFTPGSFVNTIMKSTDAGQTWDSVVNNYASLALAPAVATPIAISVAPDDVNTVAVLDNNGNVIKSGDAGATWAFISNPKTSNAVYAGSVATDLAVTPARSGTIFGREYVVSLADPTAGATGTATSKGDVLIIGDSTVWKSLGGTTANIITGAYDFTSVAVSPGYTGDRTVLAVGTGATASTTALFYFATNAVADASKILYNSVATQLGVQILTAGTTKDFDGAFAAANSIMSSSIALPTNFDPSTRGAGRAYVSFVSVAPTTDNDVYRVDDNIKAFSSTLPWTIAYSGTTDSGTLFVGPYMSPDIKFYKNPTSSTPDVSTSNTYKGASPLTNFAVKVVIRLASDFSASNMVFTGCSGIESGFSVSKDGGVSFNQEGLVNSCPAPTALAADCGVIQGLAFTGDSKSAFLNTRDAYGYIELWKSDVPFSTTSWSRVLTAPLSVNTDSSLVRLNSAWATTPAFYIAETGTGTGSGTMWVSQDGGVTVAKRSNQPATCKTYIIRDAQTVYFADNGGSLWKSTNAGFGWGTSVPGGVGTITLISLPKANQVVLSGVGSNAVVISNDDGATFTQLGTGLGNGASWYVTADSAYATNNVLYAIDTGNPTPLTDGIWRIKTDSTSNIWEGMGTYFTAGTRQTIISLRSGVVYITAFSSASGIARSLTPTDLVGNQNWKLITSGLPAYTLSGTAAPSFTSVAATAGGSNIYVRDSKFIYSFNDYLATTKPTLTAPDDNYADATNPSNGSGYPIDFKLKPMGVSSGQVTGIDIEIADKNNGFSGSPTWSNIPIAPNNPVINSATPPNSIGVTTNNPAFLFQPNKTYIWRIRASHTGATSGGQNIDDPWSDSRTINVQAGSDVQQAYAGPQLLGPQGGAQGLDAANVGFSWAPISGATEYQIIISTDAALTKTVAGTPATVTIPAYQATGLADGTTYFWAVKVTKPTASIQTVGTFITKPKAVTQPTPTTGGGTGGSTIVVQAPPAETPAYIWAVIAIGAILVIAVIILIVRTRRVP